MFSQKIRFAVENLSLTSFIISLSETDTRATQGQPCVGEINIKESGTDVRNYGQAPSLDHYRTTSAGAVAASDVTAELLWGACP